MLKEVEKVSKEAVEDKRLVAVPNSGPIDGRGRVEETKELQSER